MTESERAIVEVVKLGMGGHVDALRRFARKLLHQAVGAGGGVEYRDALAKLLVDQAGGAVLRRRTAATPIQPSNGFIRIENNPVDQCPILSPTTQHAFDTLVRERERVADLGAAGFEPTRTILLVGLPGVGKTMAVQSLAARLDLPLLTVDLAIVMSSFLGKSGQNLREAIDYARSQPCVFFVDEFDAIAKRRDDPSDVGELKRIVNVLLLELESWPASSLLAAATNHPELLDKAIWRRFDRTIAIDLPDAEARAAILRRALGPAQSAITDQEFSGCAAAIRGLSGSEIVSIVRRSMRESIVSSATGLGSVLLHAVAERLHERIAIDKAAIGAFCFFANRVLGKPLREIAVVLGISHVMVGKHIERFDQLNLAPKRPRKKKGVTT